MSIKQRGFSLVELMVALVIGLLVSGAILQTFIMNSRNIEIQRATIGLQEEGRAAINYMARYARLAGFNENDLTSPIESGAITGTSQSVSFRFRGEAPGATTVPLRDCQGSLVSAGVVSVNTFQVSGSELSCNSSQGTLVNNLEDALFLYGEDLDDDRSPDLYRMAANVNDWDEVVSIKLCLVLRSENPVLATSQSVPGILCDGSDSSASRSLLRAISTTIALRNRTGG